MTLYAFLLFVHVLAMTVWVGGMFVMHFCVRPVTVAQLPPPQRQPLLAGVLQRFFNWVALAVLLVLASGLMMFIGLGASAGAMARGESAFLTGLRLAHPSIHLMFAIGVLMMLIFAHIRFAPFKRLQRAVAASDWPAGGKALDQIRVLVAVNLALGVLTIAVATLGRALITG
jgi:uncharacterized membrane protein